MKLYKLTTSIIALLVGMNLLVAQDNADPNGEVDLAAWNVAKKNWHLLSDIKTIKANDVKSAYQAIQAAWNNLPPYWKKDTSPGMAQARIGAAVDAAKFFSNAEAGEEAVTALKEGARLSQELGVAFSQGRTDNTFRSRASIHARLLAETGADPLLGLEVGYDIWQQGNNYAVLKQGAVWEQTSSFISDDPGLLLPAEAEGKMALLDSKGMTIEEVSVAISKGSGSPKSRLAAIFKHESIQPDSAGRFTRQKPEAYFASKPNSTAMPKMVQTKQEKAPLISPPNTKIKEPASSTQWSLILVAVVAAVGLLWLFLKRRN